MISRDLVKNDLHTEMKEALESENIDNFTNVILDCVKSEGKKAVNEALEQQIKEKTNIKTLDDIGINAQNLNQKDFRKAFGGQKNDMTFSDFSKMLLNKGNNIKQEVSKRTDGSLIAPIGVAADIIYKACQKSVLLNRCPIIPMNEGTIKIGAAKDDLELDFKERGAEGKNTSLALNIKTLEAKTLYAYVEIAEEDVQDVFEIDNILLKAFSDAVAKTIDNNFLYTNENAISKQGIYPNGILDNEDINKIQVSKADYDMIAKARLTITKENGEPNVVGINPEEFFTIQTLKDSTGQYIQAPSFYSDLEKVESVGLKPKNVLVMDSNAVAIGIRKQMDIKIMNDLKKGTILMRCMLRADVLPMREKHICKIEITE